MDANTFFSRTHENDSMALGPLITESLSWDLAENKEATETLIIKEQEVLMLSDLLDDERDDQHIHGEQSYDVLVVLLTAELSCISFPWQQNLASNESLMRIA